QAEADAGERDVADAVADQGEPALDKVDAERRSGQAGDEDPGQGPLHEVVHEEVHRPFHMPGWSSRACGCTWSWWGSAWWPAGGGTAPSWATRPSWITTARLTNGAREPSSWATSSTVPPPSTKDSSALANASWLTASTPAVGSSRTSSSGWAARAR